MTFGNSTDFPFNSCNINELININNSDNYISNEVTPHTDLPNFTKVNRPLGFLI